jgi:hypothetical protein
MKIQKPLDRYEVLVCSALAALMVTLAGLLLNAGFHVQIVA